jgi:hypothetical protein
MPWTMALLLSILTVEAGASQEPPGKAAHAPAARCPLPRSEFPNRAGDVCMGMTGRNWTFAFAYPAAAARIPRLDTRLRTQERTDEANFQNLIDYARTHPGEKLHHSQVFRVDADLPALLALSSLTDEYAGGAHSWYARGALLWDRRRNRETELSDLFTRPGSALAEIAARLCPVLAQARAREFSRSGGRFNGPCPAAPYAASLPATHGRIDRLIVRFDELDGYAGGTYDVYVPVTARLRAMVRPELRTAFRASASAARACNSNLGTCVTASRPRHPQ